MIDEKNKLINDFQLELKQKDDHYVKVSEIVLLSHILQKNLEFIIKDWGFSCKTSAEPNVCYIFSDCWTKYWFLFSDVISMVTVSFLQMCLANMWNPFAALFIFNLVFLFLRWQ